MKYLIFSLFIVANLAPACATAQEEEINRKAPIIVQPKLTDTAREQMNTGFFSGIGKFFTKKEDTKQSPSNYTSNSSFKARPGETNKEKAERYLAERKERLKQRTQRADIPDARELYKYTLPSSYNELTHYKGKDGEVYQRQTPIDKDILAKVKLSAEKYAAQKGVPLEELAKDPRFNQQLEQLYKKTALAKKEAEVRAAKLAASRKAALQKRQAEEAKQKALEEKRRQRDAERSIRESGSIVDQVTR